MAVNKPIKENRLQTFFKKDLLSNIDVFAAQSRFNAAGMEVRYISPDGVQMETGLKEAHTELLRKDGYSVVYVGNGVSDIFPARQALHVFATGDLLRKCQEERLAYTPFNDLFDVIKGLENI